MQISTRDEDFIVDTLALRGKLTILNEVFTDPKIIKVIEFISSENFGSDGAKTLIYCLSGNNIRS